MCVCRQIDRIHNLYMYDCAIQLHVDNIYIYVSNRLCFGWKFFHYVCAHIQKTRPNGVTLATRMNENVKCESDRPSGDGERWTCAPRSSSTKPNCERMRVSHIAPVSQSRLQQPKTMRTQTRIDIHDITTIWLYIIHIHTRTIHTPGSRWLSRCWRTWMCARINIRFKCRHSVYFICTCHCMCGWPQIGIAPVACLCIHAVFGHSCWALLGGFSLFKQLAKYSDGRNRISVLVTEQLSIEHWRSHLHNLYQRIDLYKKNVWKWTWLANNEY